MSLVFVLVFSITVQSNASSIESEKTKKAQLEKELNNTNSLLDDLESSKSDTEAYIKKLDTKLSEIADYMQDLQDQTAAKQAEITATQAELDSTTASINEQYEAMKKRIKFMYENGNTAYIELILGSDDVTDFLNKAEYISEITSYDRKMLTKMQETKATIEQAKADLEAQNNQLNALTEEANQSQAAVQVLVSAKQSELQTYESDISDAETQVEDLQEDIKAQEELIKELEEIERKRKEEEAKRQAALVTYDGGVFAWPLPGHYTISSEYSTRTDPISGETAFHNGIDIPAPTGTQITAAYDGEVAWSYYSSTAGNWIGIDHGNGLYTIYMHCSKSLVSEGDKVTKGQAIGLVGSTGRSTGAHLHFSVRLNGEYVNPHNYVG